LVENVASKINLCKSNQVKKIDCSPKLSVDLATSPASSSGSRIQDLSSHLSPKQLSNADKTSKADSIDLSPYSPDMKYFLINNDGITFDNKESTKIVPSKE